MSGESKKLPALLVIDMVKDNLDQSRGIQLSTLAAATVPAINRLSSLFREHDWPVVFATDAYHPDDFIFEGKLPPHSIEGTDGATVVDELERTERDLWLPKPRFSAFFDTDLAGWLTERQVNLCAVAGISTNYCVLTTVMDAVCHGFRAYFVEDCCTAYSTAMHEQTLGLYRRNPLYPLLRVVSSAELIDELARDRS